jgi:MSHA biogenesis protein MshN
MSLINKMLQDLDARGTPAAESFPSQVRPVASARAGLRDRVDARALGIGAACAAAACAAGALLWFGWGHYQKARTGAKPVAAVVAPVQSKAVPTAAQPARGMSSTISMGPANAVTPAPRPLPVAEAPAVVTPVVQPIAPASARAAASDRFDAPAAKEAPAKPLPKSVAGYEPDSEDARAARQAIMAELQSRMKTTGATPLAHTQEPTQESRQESRHESRREAKRRKIAEERERKLARRAKAGADAELSASAAPSAPSAPSAKGKRGVQGVQESASQRAEGEYRRALNALQDGRMTETVAALEQALKLDPGHDAARQTLVGLLIEARRPDDAIRHLQAGLALDPRQPSLAMLLARLQIERGGSGIDTLTRTLPYAGKGTSNGADYHAFLAGALQREQRHREAAEQYQAALRSAPGNGVWWMGLGMSLQAEKRNAEALEAFQRARASGTLSADLLAFVERRLQQLAR